VVYLPAAYLETPGRSCVIVAHRTAGLAGVQQPTADHTLARWLQNLLLKPVDRSGQRLARIQPFSLGGFPWRPFSRLPRELAVFVD
jgi:hypothetical protein